jgi:hypothetical protein
MLRMCHVPNSCHAVRPSVSSLSCSAIACMKMLKYMRRQCCDNHRTIVTVQRDS